MGTTCQFLICWGYHVANCPRTGGTVLVEESDSFGLEQLNKLFRIIEHLILVVRKLLTQIADHSQNLSGLNHQLHIAVAN